jgi:hypothetical protein
MSYIGVTPSYGDMKSEVFSGNSSLTSFTLTGGSVANDASLLVSISGVTQKPGTDYSVTGLTSLVFTTAPPTGSSNILVIFLGRQVDVGTVGSGAIGSSQVSADMVGGQTDATITASDELIYKDQTDGALKKDTIQGVLDLVPVNGWEFVSSAVASASTSLSFTNMVSGYDYEYVLDTIISASDGVGFEAEVGVSGPTYRTSNYEGQVQGINDSGVSQSGEYQDRFEICDGATEQLGTGTNEVLANGSFFLNNPAGTSNMTSFRSLSFLRGSNVEEVMQIAGGLQTAVEAHTCVKFACSSGNIASGNIFQYRRKRS